MTYDLRGKRVWVAGAQGMVGSAIVRRLAAEECDILTVEREALDLMDQRAVRDWMARERPEAVFLAAAKVGGILANDSYPASFLYDNLMIAANVIEAAHRSGTEKLCFLGSSCIYPKLAEQPMREDQLLTGQLESTNQWYAIAKIAGIKLTQAYRRQHGADFISVMPTNLYGPGDNFDLQSSHVIPALIHKAHKAKISGERLVIWGSGKPRREFLYVDDCADACIHLMKVYSGDEHVNVGCGEDMAIGEVTDRVAAVVGYDGPIERDLTKPDGTPRKLLDIGKLKALGWRPYTAFDEGLTETYRWFLANVDI